MKTPQKAYGGFFPGPMAALFMLLDGLDVRSLLDMCPDDPTQCAQKHNHGREPRMGTMDGYRKLNIYELLGLYKSNSQLSQRHLPLGQ
mgnify:CR=1 FL=1